MGKKVKLLYVDDEDINLELFGIVFKTKFDVLTAKSASEGLNTLENNQDIMVVISDMKRAFTEPSFSNKVPRSKMRYLIKIWRIIIGMDSKHNWTIPLCTSSPSHYS